MSAITFENISRLTSLWNERSIEDDEREAEALAAEAIEHSISKKEFQLACITWRRNFQAHSPLVGNKRPSRDVCFGLGIIKPALLRALDEIDRCWRAVYDIKEDQKGYRSLALVWLAATWVSFEIPEEADPQEAVASLSASALTQMCEALAKLKIQGVCRGYLRDLARYVHQMAFMPKSASWSGHGDGVAVRGALILPGAARAVPVTLRFKAERTPLEEGFYRSPSLAFLTTDKLFEEAELDAANYARKCLRWPEDYSVKWSLFLDSGDPVPVTIHGNSLGGAFAIGLLKALIAVT